MVEKKERNHIRARVVGKNVFWTQQGNCTYKLREVHESNNTYQAQSKPNSTMEQGFEHEVLPLAKELLD